MERKPCSAQLQWSEDQIDWVLSQPGMSHWLKQALRRARERSPTDTLNDLEVLNLLLRQRSAALLEQAADDGNHASACPTPAHRRLH